MYFFQSPYHLELFLLSFPWPVCSNTREKGLRNMHTRSVLVLEGDLGVAFPRQALLDSPSVTSVKST